MREFGGISASDLMRFIGCAHAMMLDLMHLRGQGPEAGENGEDAALLQKQGHVHEMAHLARLKGSGSPSLISRAGPTARRGSQACSAMMARVV